MTIPDQRPALTPHQKWQVEHARALVAARAEGPAALAAFLQAAPRDDVPATAWGSASVHLEWLLDVVDELAGGAR